MRFYFNPWVVFASLFLLISSLSNAQANQLAEIKTSKELKVCIWPEYYAITYRNPKTHKLNGIDIELAQALGKELGVAIRYVDSSFSLLVENFLKGRCDIAMHAIGVTPERAQKLQFTKPYLYSDIYAVTTKNNQAIKTWSDLDVSGHVIAVQIGTVMEPVMRNYLKKASLVIVKPPMRREQEVESGRVDAFMTDYPYSQRMLATADWARVVSPERPFHITEYAYALAPGDSSLLAVVNDFIERFLQDGRLRQIAKSYKLESIVISQ